MQDYVSLNIELFREKIIKLFEKAVNPQTTKESVFIHVAHKSSK